jgi:hypothetical protein
VNDEQAMTVREEKLKSTDTGTGLFTLRSTREEHRDT